jgi:SinI restriction endonuclease
MVVNFEQIIDEAGSEKKFLQIFRHAFQQQEQQLSAAHQTILMACYQHPGLAPSLKGQTAEDLALAWLKKYNDGFASRISQRISQPPATIADPIVSTIILAKLPELVPEQIEQIKYAHRLSMSAENIQGLLLEEFLSEQLADYGWYCCWGESVKHVDFCNVDGSLLQVKNRSNSENSSSSRVRIDRPIDKWYRVNASNGQYRWSQLNEKYATDRFSEENFVLFVRRILAQNPAALAVEHNNPWQNSSS